MFSQKKLRQFFDGKKRRQKRLIVIGYMQNLEFFWVLSENMCFFLPKEENSFEKQQNHNCPLQ